MSPMLPAADLALGRPLCPTDRIHRITAVIFARFTGRGVTRLTE